LDETKTPCFYICGEMKNLKSKFNIRDYGENMSAMNLIETAWWMIAMGIFTLLSLTSIGILVLCIGKAIEFIQRSYKPKAVGKAKNQ
jgi:hypothetical protein